jgi:predicted DNA-binding protein (UPF0251 family)
MENRVKHKKGRPRKRKIVHEQPRIDHFSPRGRPGRPDEVVIAIEEYESIRLADHLGMDQKEAADMMGISQQSFSRLVRKARKMVADAIVNAKIIRIEGGDYIDQRSLDIANKLKRHPGPAVDPRTTAS